MQFCPSFHIVQLMKNGRSPQQACDEVVREMKRESARPFEVGLIALNNKVINGQRLQWNLYCMYSPKKTNSFKRYLL